MSSLAVKRIIAGVIGLFFAVVYGFWTMLATGGGHGNFLSLMLFIFVEFFGLYFPLMAILAVNLRTFIVKVIFGSLIAFNLIFSCIMIIGWITDTEIARNSLTDFDMVIQSNGTFWVVFMIGAHFFPTLIFAFLLLKSILFGESLPYEDDSVSLNLT